jgi:2-alkenal reductase
MQALDGGEARSADDDPRRSAPSTPKAADSRSRISPSWAAPAASLWHQPAKTQRLGPIVGSRGVSPRLAVGVAVLSLVLGGAAGAGAGAMVAHHDDAARDAGGMRSPPRFATQSTALDSAQSPAANAANLAGPAVVSILNNQQPRLSFYGATPSTSAGSGVIIAKNGYILTNYHVVTQERDLRVTFANGISTAAILVGGDPTTDIAVIKVNVPVPAVAVFGDSKKVRPGETVIAIGNALGDLQNTITEGIISGLGRTLPNGNDATGNSSLQNLIQTDAAINHGNSGGPLVDMTGHVIGINTAVVRASGTDSTQYADQAEGLGFAIPGNTAKAVADRLIFHTPSPYLGIDYAPVSAQVAGLYRLPVGAIVKTVVPNSPAKRAGCRVGDVITTVNGQAIDDQHDLKTVLDTYHVRDKVSLRIYRAGRILTFTATLVKTPS